MILSHLKRDEIRQRKSVDLTGSTLHVQQQQELLHNEFLRGNYLISLVLDFN